MFVHVNPVQIHFHLDSCLWLNAFALNLHESLLRNSFATAADPSTVAATVPNEPGLMYMDVKFEAIMPRIVIECPADAPVQRDRPKAMQIQISRVLCTNIRELGATRADLAQALHSLQEGSLVFASDFPARPDDLCVVTDRILAHVAATDVQPASGSATPDRAAPQSPTTASDPLGRYAFCAEPRDVWCMKLDPLWIDFLGARSVGHSKSVPFVDAVPITLWLHGRTPSDDQNANPFDGDNDSAKRNDTADGTAAGLADLHVIAHIANMVSVQIDHYQYLFLLRLAEEMTELGTFISLDADRIQLKTQQPQQPEKSIVFGCVVPQLELTLVMPSQTPGKESSGCDAESVVPDSVSICGEEMAQMPPPPMPSVGNYAAAIAAAKCNGELTRTQAVDRSPDDGGSVAMPSIGSPTRIAEQTPTKRSEPVAAPATPSISMSSSMTTSTTRPSSSRAARGSQGDSGFKEFGSSLLTMKKGFSNFMTSIDSALKSGSSGVGGVADDASDSFSIQSDISSDSENFMLVLGDDKTTDCMEVMFK